MSIEKRRELIAKIEHERGSKVLCYVTSDLSNIPGAPNIPPLNQMQKSVLPIVNEHLRGAKSYKTIDFLIFTHGGDTLAGFGLSRILREYSDDINVFIPDCCHSSGTLFALGANRIHMSKGATLSPIDPSITGNLNPAVQTMPGLPPQLIPLSVESVAGYFDLISKSWHVGKKVELLKELTSKVHPLALGDVYRVRQQIERLAKQLLKEHRRDAGRINAIVKELSKGLGTHDYLIYYKEAKRLLGKQVVHDEAIEPKIFELFQEYKTEMQLGTSFNPGMITAGSPPNAVKSHDLTLAVFESSSLTHFGREKLELSDNIVTLQTPIGPRNQKMTMQQIISSEWVRG